MVEQGGEQTLIIFLWWGPSCAGSVGLFLLVKKCTVLYLATENGSFSNGPFLDEHGEHDTGMK